MRATTDFGSFFKRQRSPVTFALIGGIVGFAALFFFLRVPLDNLIVTGISLSRPWTLLTYPFAEPFTGAGLGVVGLVLLGFWMYWIGGSLESDYGSPKLLALWAVGSVIPALFVLLGAELLGKLYSVGVAGAVLPVSFITVIWGVRNKTACIMLMAIIPMTGFYLALLTLAIVLVDFGAQNPLLGVFVLIPYGGAWLFAEDKFPGLGLRKKEVTVAYKPSKEARKREEAYFDDVRKREKERDERERLRKLFEGSLNDDDSR